MMEHREPSNSSGESEDVVDVDDHHDSSDSELSVVSSSHQQQLDRDVHEETTTATSNKSKTNNKNRIDNKSSAKMNKRTVTSKKAKQRAVIQKAPTKSSASTIHADDNAETAGDSGSSSCGLEASVEQVAERFAQGCECRDEESCFANINPEAAYRHRLNIAELTRSEHDMYLMGVTMASLSNPEETARRTERKRLHTQYVFQVR